MDQSVCQTSELSVAHRKKKNNVKAQSCLCSFRVPHFHPEATEPEATRSNIILAPMALPGQKVLSRFLSTSSLYVGSGGGGTNLHVEIAFHVFRMEAQQRRLGLAGLKLTSTSSGRWIRFLFGPV